MEFGKYEGAGNDFILIDNRSLRFVPDPKTIAALCDRRFGIGADGLMLLEKDDKALFKMRYFNSDGPEATMCGNGGRCIALFALHLGVPEEKMTFNAIDGMHYAEVLSRTANTAVISLEMTKPGKMEKLKDGYFINTGSPHYVTFVDDVDSVDVFGLGRSLRNSPEVVERGGANVNFVEVSSSGVLKVRTYERGVEDETLACGTGAVASALVAEEVKFSGKESFDIHVRGGRLSVSFAKEDGEYSAVRLIGPARRVYKGSFEEDNFLY